MQCPSRREDGRPTRDEWGQRAVDGNEKPRRFDAKEVDLDDRSELKMEITLQALLGVDRRVVAFSRQFSL